MSDIKKDIRKLLKEKNAILLAHNYQRDEVQEIADFSGDSLGLSEVARDFKAEAIIFCGVHFMAESAAILAPNKKIIMPRVDAGCPMADMITAEDVEEIREERPNVPIVAYVNTSAEVKAHSDICCTSGNAINVVNSLPQDEAYLIPDKNLAQYIQRGTSKKLSWWDGFCPTHEWLKVEDIEKAKEANPGSLFLCHPECNPSVVDIADHVCSTSGMYKWAKETDAKSIIVGTEMGILYRLRKDNPEKKFILASECLCCPNMKLTTLEDIHESLMNMNNNIITVEEDIRLKAKATLDKMLAIPRNA